MSQISFIDSHVHLDRYTDEQCLAMLNRAAKVGVRTILTVGVDVYGLLTSSPKKDGALTQQSHIPPTPGRNELRPYS